MKTQKITIENLKCHGCANTIKRELNKIPEVTNVAVSHEEQMVIIDYDSQEDMKETFTKRLVRLGYPEKGNKNLGNQVRSYVSCAIGRMSKEA
jgi:copper chaperone CopZ